MMRWLPFAIALLAVLLLQTTVVPFLPLPGLDLLLTLALVCGLVAPAPEARLAGWITGFAKDLDTLGPVGLHALALGLAALLLTRLRELVNLHLWWVRGFIAFVVAVPAELLVLLHQRFLQGLALGPAQIVFGALGHALLAALLAMLVTGLPAALGRPRRRRFPAPRW